MKKKIFAAIMAVCLLAGTSAFAQGSKAPATKERPTIEQMAQRKTERMTEKLGLNEQQAKQIYALNLQQMKDMQANREQMRATQQAAEAKMKTVLTPAQVEQWQLMQQAREAKAGARDGKMHSGDKKCADKKDSACCAKEGDKKCADGKEGNKPGSMKEKR